MYQYIKDILDKRLGKKRIKSINEILNNHSHKLSANEIEAYTSYRDDLQDAVNTLP